MFVDRVTINVKGGDGGNGCLAFRREKYVPRGGPSGGDGGDGGSIILRAVQGVTNLAHLSSQRHWKADRGEHGQGSDCHGKSAEDLIIEVPAGTIVRDRDRGHLLRDLKQVGDWVAVAKGGQRRARQQILQVEHQPRPPTGRKRGVGRGAVDHPRTQGDRRRRPGRPAQRRQVDAPVEDLPRPSRDRRLPVHDQVPQPRHGLRRRPLVRRRRHPRPDRGRPRGARPRPRVPPPRRADPAAGPPGRRRRRSTARTRSPTTGRSARSWSCTARPSPPGPRCWS